MKKVCIVLVALSGLSAIAAAVVRAANERAAKPSRTMSIIDLSKPALDAATFSTSPDHPFMQNADKTPILAGEVDTFSSADNRLSVGLSKYKKVTLKLTNWPVDEVMLLLEGQVEITDSVGHSKIYKAGDLFIMPKGFNGTWRQLTDIKKMQVTYSPPE
jgi:uncharacterized protein